MNNNTLMDLSLIKISIFNLTQKIKQRMSLFRLNKVCPRKHRKYSYFRNGVIEGWQGNPDIILGKL